MPLWWAVYLPQGCPVLVIKGYLQNAWVIIYECMTTLECSSSGKFLRKPLFQLWTLFFFFLNTSYRRMWAVKIFPSLSMKSAGLMISPEGFPAVWTFRPFLLWWIILMTFWDSCQFEGIWSKSYAMPVVWRLVFQALAFSLLPSYLISHVIFHQHLH